MSKEEEQQSKNVVPEFPSYADQGKNLTELISKFVDQALEGDMEILVDEFEKNRRFCICQACPYYHRASKRCKKCGCFLPPKVRLKVSECPIKKW